MTMPLVFSYLRFSTPDQARGDSMRRQLELSAEWCRSKGLVLDESLRMSDQGISAYKGKNKTKGALSEFISNLNLGLVPEGSILLVESLDRLSREDVFTALGSFTDIIGKGVRIVTLQDGMEYNHKTKENIGQLMYSLIMMSTAHEESKKKSARLGAAWSNKKKIASATKPMGKKCPAWMQLVDGKYKIIESKAQIVKDIVKMSADGIGHHAIATKLNSEKVKMIGKGTKWHKSYIRKILTDLGPIGIYQPHTKRNGKRVPDGSPIAGYYPAIVPEDVYYRSMQSITGRRNKRGRTAKKQSNLFQGLMYWGGSREGLGTRVEIPFHWHCKWKDYQYISIETVKGTIAKKIDYKKFENVMLRCLGELDLNKVIRKETTHEREAAARSLVQRIKGVSKLIAAQEEQQQQDAEAGEDPDKSIIQALKKHNAAKDVLERELSQIQASAKIQSHTDNEIKSLVIGKLTDVETRVRMSNAIRNMVARIEILHVGESDGIVNLCVAFKSVKGTEVIRGVWMDLENNTFKFGDDVEAFTIDGQTKI
jgi:DNA invertase Pin-like site-specific DNA recombinase